MKQNNYFYILLLFFSTSLAISQTVIDDFTDGNFTSNQTWTGSTSAFSVITDATLPNGSASTDGSYLASNVSEGDVSLAFPSNEISEWHFSLGTPNYNPSGSNYIGVVLMASSTFSGDLINDNVTNNFQGYYLRIGDSGTDPIELWRKTGTGEEIVGDFPSSPSFSSGDLKDGLNIRVTRSSTGVWELFYSIGFQNNSIPSNSAGRLTNNTYTSSSFFGIFQNIGSTSSTRRIYIDNIELGVVTWDGSDNNDWSTGTNWDTNSTPTSTDNLIIPSGLTNYPTVTTAETINSLIIASGATLVATNAGFTVTGNATYTRNLPNGSQWYLMGVPVSGENFNNTWVTDNSIPSSTLDVDNRGISWYDNSSSDTDSEGGGTSDSATGFWRYMAAGDDNPFAVARGYGIIRSSVGDVSFTGNGIYSSNQTFSLTQGLNNFNLVGNPFTAFITLGTFHTTNTSNIGTDFFFWNGGSTYVTKLSGIDGAYEIAPGQGFFVEATNTNNVIFEITDASHQGSDTFGKTTNQRPEVHLSVNDGNGKIPIRILYIDGTTKGYDVGYDGKLFDGVSYNFIAYSDLVESNGIKYQTQSLPNTDHETMIIPIGLKATANKEITFTAEALNIPNGLHVYLEDRQTGGVTRLDETNTEYKVTLTENLDGIGRFYLHTRTNSTLSTDDVLLNSVRIFSPNPNKLRIAGLQQGNASVRIFNMLGKQVVNSTFVTSGVSDLDLPNLANGVYIIQLETANGSINKKITLE